MQEQIDIQMPRGYQLCVLENCNSKDKFEQWKKDKNLGNIDDIGCGINVLTYLGMITREEGTQLVLDMKEKFDKSKDSEGVEQFKGTPFIEMMNYAFNKDGVVVLVNLVLIL